MPLAPPVPAPANTLVYSKVAAYCNQFMNPYHTYIAPAPGSSAYVMCVKYGWNLPVYHGTVNLSGFGGGGGLAVVAIFLFILYKIRRKSGKTAPGKA